MKLSLIMINYIQKKTIKKSKKLVKNLDLSFQPKIFEADTIYGAEFSFDKLEDMLKKDPKYFIETWLEIEKIHKRINIASIFEKPEFNQEFFKSDNEKVDKICTSWKEFDEFMRSNYNLAIGTSGFATA